MERQSNSAALSEATLRNLISECLDDENSDTGVIVIMEIAERLADSLRRTTPTFSLLEWRQACGYEIRNGELHVVYEEGE